MGGRLTLWCCLSNWPEWQKRGQSITVGTILEDSANAEAVLPDRVGYLACLIGREENGVLLLGQTWRMVLLLASRTGGCLN